MGRVVILEGADGGGKTTLAKRLVEEGFEYRHEGPPPSKVDLVAHYLDILDKSLKSNKNVVHDRLWLGERVYGPVCRGEDRLGDAGQVLFERLHRSKSIHQYICTPRLGIARVNYLQKIKEDDDYLKSTERWERAYEYYNRFANTQKVLSDFTFDYTTHTFEDVLREVMSTRKVMANLPEGTIGSTQAKYLFIGDQPNHTTIDVPFFSLRGSSGYFNSALVMAGIKEEDLALSNARSPSAVIHSLGSILCRLPNLEIVFLMGVAAVEWFKSQSDVSKAYKVVRIPHPSFLKRFRGHNPAVMADLIKKGLNG